MTLHKYDALMEKVEVTEEMRARILANACKEAPSAPEKVIRFPLKRILPLAACLVALLCGALALPGLLPGGPEDSEPPVLTAPNISEATSAEELSRLVGFAVQELPAFASEAAETHYLAYGETLAEIEYILPGQRAVFRKSAGEEDNSGDYTEYGSVIETELPSGTAVLKGDGGSYRLAVWAKDGFALSLWLETPVPAETLKQMIAEAE